MFSHVGTEPPVPGYYLSGNKSKWRERTLLLLLLPIHGPGSSKNVIVPVGHEHGG